MSDYDNQFCASCGDRYMLEPGLEPTKFCNLCAQSIIERLIEITPEPPQAITWEQGVEILNVLQKELYQTP